MRGIKTEHIYQMKKIHQALIAEPQVKNHKCLQGAFWIIALTISIAGCDGPKEVPYDVNRGYVSPDPIYLNHPNNIPNESQRGGVLVAATVANEPHPIGTIASGNVNIPGSQLNASLLRWTDDYKPMPYLATVWSFSKDGLTFNFTLHPEARFHDGEDITCTDVAFSIQMSKSYHPFRPMFAPVTQVTGGESKHCSMELTKPHPALLTALSPGLLPIIPEHIFNDGQSIISHPRLTKDVVGSGPFKLVDWNPKDVIRFVRNDDFFIKGLPYLDEIVFDVVPDPSAVTIGLATGAYDIGDGYTGDDIEAAKKISRIKVLDKGWEAIGAITWVQINMRDSILKDHRVRQALAYAYDFDEFNDIIYAGQHRLQCTGIQNQSSYYNPNAECYELNLTKAKALLADAGYPNGIELEMLIPSRSGEIAQAEVLQQQWSKIGVSLKIRTVADEPSLIKALTAENADYQLSLAAVWNWGDPVIGVNRTYKCDNRLAGVAWSNMSWYCNKDVDQLLDAAGLELNENKRKELYWHATERINIDLPVIYLTNFVYYTRTQKTLNNPPDGIWGWMDSWAEAWIKN